jgi:CRP/FNR family cyclic AMP-dependent transcriptional regulator
LRENDANLVKSADRPPMIAIEALKSVPLFSALSPEQLSMLANCVSLQRYPRGAHILREGRLTDALYIIRSGRAKVFESRPDGREVIFSIMGPGDFFGEMALLDDLPCSADVETLEPSELMRIAKTDFTQRLAESFDLTARIMVALVGRLRRADRQIESLALMDIYGRVARVLLELAEPIDGTYTIAKAPSRLDVARMVGASREMVSRVLKELQASGHILVDKRRIVLLDKLRIRHRFAASKK